VKEGNQMLGFNLIPYTEEPEETVIEILNGNEVVGTISITKNGFRIDGGLIEGKEAESGFADRTYFDSNMRFLSHQSAVL